MHFNTRCPACGTLFRVPTDQLKESGGWVRCGSCADVFDATQHLLLELETPKHAPPAAPLGASTEPVLVAPSQGMDPRATVATGTFTLHLSRDDSNPVPVDPAVARQAIEQALPVNGPALGETLSEPDFVRRARRRAFWRSPGMRAALGLLALVLTSLLLFQWTLHQRDQLAASEPEWERWLAKVCDSLGCEIAPVRRIDAIMIDSTVLVRQLDGVYAFDFVLKNTASIPLAMPALELTLTQLGDVALARRVFLASELAGAPALLPARGSVALRLRLSLAVSDVSSMQGYRALVFYP